ncbi:hypothetical protein BAZOLSSOX_768, partial [uncultured Gammaproteobacteria bacterium]
HLRGSSVSCLLLFVVEKKVDMLQHYPPNLGGED